MVKREGRKKSGKPFRTSKRCSAKSELVNQHGCLGNDLIIVSKHPQRPKKVSAVQDIPGSPGT